MYIIVYKGKKKKGNTNNKKLKKNSCLYEGVNE